MKIKYDSSRFFYFEPLWHRNAYSGKNSSPPLLLANRYRDLFVSIDKRRTEIVEAAIDEIIENGKAEFKPGDVADLLRDKNDPISVWQLRAEFSSLEESGVIDFDSETALWKRSGSPSIKSAL